MKMTKCYTNIFTEPLEKLGFKKYGVLYCRAMGEIIDNRLSLFQSEQTGGK